MDGKHKKGKPKQAARFAWLGLLVFLSFAVPPKQAHAQFGGLCDVCALAAFNTLAADIVNGLAAIAEELVAINTLLIDPGIGFPSIYIALYGGRPPVVPPGPGLDNDVNAGFATVIEAIDLLATEATPMGSQGPMDAKGYYGEQQSIANMTPDKYSPMQSIHCATAYAMNMQSQMREFVRIITQTTMKLMRDYGTGPQASGGAGLAKEITCGAAPFRVGSTRISTQIAAALATCPQAQAMGAAPANFQDADLDVGSVFDRMQFTIPSGGGQATRDNYINFTPGGDPGQWAYVAAWRYCEHYIPTMAPPPNGANTVLTVSDIMREATDATTAVYKMPALRECLQAIAERTACPRGGATNPTDTTPGGVQASCWQIQDIACHRLTAVAPSGLQLTDVGNEEVNYALKNCDTDGLSYRAFMYAWDHRCVDPNYSSVIIPREYAKTTAVRQESQWCDESSNSAEAHFAAEEENFINAMDLVLLGGTGAGGGPNPSQQSVTNPGG